MERPQECLIVQITTIVNHITRILLREGKHVIFVMEQKSVGLVVVIVLISTHLLTREWLVQIAPMVGVADVMAQEEYNRIGGKC